jgi:beta-mannosidase
MTEEDIFGDDTYMSEFHTKNNPGLPVRTIYGYVDIMSKKIFGDFKDGADRVLKMQMLQCEWVRLSLELARRNKWYSSGIIYWMYNDCWPAANGWSLVDYYANPKPSYYAFKRAAKPVIGSICEENGILSVSVCNDSLSAVSGAGKIYVYDFVKNENLWEDSFDFSVKGNASELIYSTDFENVNKYLSESTVILCDIDGEDISDRAMFIKDRFKDLDIKYCDVKIVKDDDSEITVIADEFLPYAVIDVPYLLEDNCFVLKKGEMKTIKKIKNL